eukprot:4194380-Amphidinium_carterae.1
MSQLQSDVCAFQYLSESLFNLSYVDDLLIEKSQRSVIHQSARYASTPLIPAMEHGLTFLAEGLTEELRFRTATEWKRHQTLHPEISQLHLISPSELSVQNLLPVESFKVKENTTVKSRVRNNYSRTRATIAQNSAEEELYTL